MARICGVCARAPREGEEMIPIRLRTDEDLEATGRDEAGLYSACLECVEDHRVRVFSRDDNKCDTLQEVSNKGLL